MGLPIVENGVQRHQHAHVSDRVQPATTLWMMMGVLVFAIFRSLKSDIHVNRKNEKNIFCIVKKNYIGM